MDDQYVTTTEAAKRLGISREHVRRLIQRGELPARETVTGFMVDSRDVERVTAERRLIEDQRILRKTTDEMYQLAKETGVLDPNLKGVLADIRATLKAYPAAELAHAMEPSLAMLKEQAIATGMLAQVGGHVEQMGQTLRDMQTQIHVTDKASNRERQAAPKYLTEMNDQVVAAPVNQHWEIAHAADAAFQAVRAIPDVKRIIDDQRQIIDECRMRQVTGIDVTQQAQPAPTHAFDVPASQLPTSGRLVLHANPQVYERPADSRMAQLEARVEALADGLAELKAAVTEHGRGIETTPTSEQPTTGERLYWQEEHGTTDPEIVLRRFAHMRARTRGTVEDTTAAIRKSRDEGLPRE